MLTPAGGRARGLRLLRRFAEAEDGVAATELALILPAMLMIYFGIVEISNMMGNTRKVDLLSRTVGDLVGGFSAPTKSQIDDIFQSAKVVLAPFDGSNVELVVSAVGVFGSAPGGQMRVCSSVAASGATPRPVGDTPEIPLPSGFQTDGVRLLLVEVKMPYRPVAGDTFMSLFGQSLDRITFSRQLFWPVRIGRRFASQSPEVVLPAGSACPAK